MTEWHLQPGRQRSSRLPYWMPTVPSPLPTTSAARTMAISFAVAVVAFLVVSYPFDDSFALAQWTSQRMLLNAFEPLLEEEGATQTVQIKIDAKFVLALQDRHASGGGLMSSLKGKIGEKVQKNERFAVVKVERGDCDDEKCENLQTDANPKNAKGCRNRCVWNKKQFSSAEDPKKPDGSFLFWIDTSTAKVDADKLLLCAEFSPQYHVRFARTYSLEDVVARGGEEDGAMAGRNRVRNECRFFAGDEEITYVDEHDSKWLLTDHDMTGLNGAAPGVLMIMKGIDVKKTMNEIKKTAAKGIFKGSAKVAAFAVGGIAIGLLTGGASVATSGTYFLSQVAKGTAEGMWANEVEKQLSAAAKNKMATHRYAALPPEIKLTTQNIYVRKMGGILEDNKVTCVFVPGPPRCLAFDEENKPLQMFEDTSAGECYNGEQPCTFARVMEMTEGGATARIVHGTQQLCRNPQSNVADLFSTSWADKKENQRQCVWDILIGSDGRVFVARMAKVGDEEKWLLPYTDAKSQNPVSAKHLQLFIGKFLLSKFDALLYEPDTAFGKLAHAAVEAAGKMNLAMTDKE